VATSAIAGARTEKTSLATRASNPENKSAGSGIIRHRGAIHREAMPVIPPAAEKRDVWMRAPASNSSLRYPGRSLNASPAYREVHHRAALRADPLADAGDAGSCRRLISVFQKSRLMPGRWKAAAPGLPAVNLRLRAAERDRAGIKKFSADPLKPESVFFIFFSPSRGGVPDA
jgi:hypothetical protein